MSSEKFERYHIQKPYNYLNYNFANSLLLSQCKSSLGHEINIQKTPDNVNLVHTENWLLLPYINFLTSKVSVSAKFNCFVENLVKANTLFEFQGVSLLYKLQVTLNHFKLHLFTALSKRANGPKALNWDNKDFFLKRKHFNRSRQNQ